MILKSKVFSGLCGFKGFVLVMPVMDVRALPRVILLLMGPAEEQILPSVLLGVLLPG